MLAATDAAFTAAHLRHLKQLADDAVLGPYLQPPRVNGSTSLFSDPFRASYDHFATTGALFLTSDADKPTDQPKQLFLPHLQVLESADPPAALTAVSKTLNAAVN